MLLSNLTTKKKILLVGVFIAIIVTVLLLGKGGLTSILGPVVIDNSVPPVVTRTSDLNLLKVTPPAGKRSSPDAFTQTYFEFSADLDEKSVNVTVTPNILLKVRVYAKEPRVLVVEPQKVSWQSGVEYTITIRNLRGLNGEELRNPVEYKFSNTIPATIEGGDP